MEARHAGVNAPEGTPTGSPPVRILAADGIHEVVRERGGSLYLWTDVHGVCEGKVTLLQVGTERPSDADLRFERIGADGFVTMAVFLELNGVELEADEAEVVTVMLGLAAGELSEKQLAAWVRTRTASAG